MRATSRLLALIAIGCSGIAGAVTACGFDGEGALPLTVAFEGGAGGEASAPGAEGGPITVEGGGDIDGAPIEGDAAPCTLGGGGAGVMCAGKCVDTARNHDHCGGCDVACPKSSACEGTCVVVAKTLEGMRYEIPCLDTGSPYCNGGSPPPASKTVTLTGTTGKSYVIGIRVRGVVEQNSYAGMTAGGAAGTNAAFFVFGGAATNGNWNTYSLAVSSPAKNAFLNNGAAGHSYVDGIDYTARLDVNAGATITLASSSIDNLIARNRDQAGSTAIIVAGVPPAPAAYNGQFVQVDVESVALAP